MKALLMGCVGLTDWFVGLTDGLVGLTDWLGCFSWFMGIV